MDFTGTTFLPYRKEPPIWKDHVLWFALICVWTRLATNYMHNPFFAPNENFPYYLLSYRLEFTPRAVIGTIYDLLRSNLEIGWNTFCILRFAFCVLAYTLATIGLYRLLNNIQDRCFASLFGLFLFAIPSTFHPAAIITLFDHYLVAIMLTAVWLIQKGRSLPYLLVPPLCILAVLIHENFLFMYLPFLVGVLVWQDEKHDRCRWLKASLVVFSTIGAFMAMFLRRSYLHKTPGMLDALNQTLQQRAAEHGVELSNCLNTLELTYWEHVKSVWSHFFLEQNSPYQLAINVISLVIWIPALLVISSLWRNAWQQTQPELRRRLLMFGLSCFGGCALFIVAHDYIRWVTAILICNSVALILLYTDERLHLRFNLTAGQMIRWCCISLFYLCLDPPSSVCFTVADFLAYPVFKLCM